MEKGHETRPLQVRFWEKVSKTATCWLWTASKNKYGYGKFSVHSAPRLAHRVSWEIENGSIPDGFHALHKCDNTSCVNPEHLFLGTHSDNMKDMTAKGRRADSSRKGERCHLSKLTEQKVLAIRAVRDIPPKQLGAMFGVTGKTVIDIQRLITWKHLKPSTPLNTLRSA